eukprot:4343139-Alexandrium_andersonii.AAC.1
MAPGWCSCGGDYVSGIRTRRCQVPEGPSARSRRADGAADRACRLSMAALGAGHPASAVLISWSGGLE